MRVVNTVELKNRTNRLLKYVGHGRPIAVTRRGKPCAALIPLNEDELEEFIFEYSPETRRLIAEAEADIRAGRVVRWSEFLKHEARRKAA